MNGFLGRFPGETFRQYVVRLGISPNTKPCPSSYVEGDSGTLLRCLYEEGHEGEHCAPLYIHWVADESGQSIQTDMDLVEEA